MYYQEGHHCTVKCARVRKRKKNKDRKSSAYKRHICNDHDQRSLFLFCATSLYRFRSTLDVSSLYSLMQFSFLPFTWSLFLLKFFGFHLQRHLQAIFLFCGELLKTAERLILLVYYRSRDNSKKMTILLI